MDSTTLTLCTAAAGIGLVHTLVGPDHYLPFVAMSRARGWSRGKTLRITALCGVGHVASSIILGFVGLGIGTALEKLQLIESSRGTLAGWMLLSFGIIYLVWGLRHAARSKPHTHWHAHADGTVHAHEHTHEGAHLHVHEEGTEGRRDRGTKGREGIEGLRDQGIKGDSDPRANITPWVLFTIFLFGPCEPLIPLLMFPAWKGSIATVILVSTTFAAATLTAMCVCVLIGTHLANAPLLKPLEKYHHALAGTAVTACGAAVVMGL